MAPIERTQKIDSPILSCGASSAIKSAPHSKSLHIAPSPPSTQHTPTANFTIKTSKKWVLPPRPKPGRKPIDTDHQLHSGPQEEKKARAASPGVSSATNIHHSAAAQHQLQAAQPILPAPETHQHAQTTTKITAAAATSSRAQSPAPKAVPAALAPAAKEKPKAKRGRKSNSEKARQSELTSNPIRQAILKINEENYYLKLEVIKLVSDLKSLKQEAEKAQTDPLIQQQEQQDISSVPMDYNSSSTKTNNNNTIYRINSNTATDASTPLMTTTSSPLTTATSPADTPAAASHGKKRAHDNEVDPENENINDLILSLIDLNHSKTVSPLTSNNLNSLHSEQIVDVTAKMAQRQQQQQQQAACNNNFNCTNFLNLDHIEEEEEEAVISSSPNHDFIHDDSESVDVESLTPTSLLSLTKTNSTIDEIEVDLDAQHHHFSPQLIDIPEVVLGSAEAAATAQNTINQTHQGVTDQEYEFSFWKSSASGAATGNDKLKKNVVFNTNSTLDELVMERQREREQELLSYYEFNDLIDFETTSNTNENNAANDMTTMTKGKVPIKVEEDVGHVVFNDDWRLDDDNLLNF